MAGPADYASLRRVLLAAAGVALAASLAVPAQPAAAAYAPDHDPIGAVTKMVHSAGWVTFKGWAADPDARLRRAVLLTLVDGHRRTTTRTSLAYPHLSARKHLGARPGFDVNIRVPQDGAVHTICLAVRNVGPGMTRVLRCALSPSVARTAPVRYAHSPHGALTDAHLHRGWLHVSGWTVDPDFVASRSTVVLYVNGVAAETVRTTPSTRRDRIAGAGPHGAFRFVVPVTRGSSVGCAWAVDEGIGDNNLLGCHAVDTRRAGHGKVHESRANRKVVREAHKHLGGKYVWGAEGPKKFDCSGLVQYSYAKAKRSVPRIAADQFHAAYKIPASRAVPGDLVFYFNGLGYVHHVGIYLRPGMSIAPAEGIDYQPIYPGDATYGSFTHH
jgi:cell wall-associated NlpC family hydrolase